MFTKPKQRTIILLTLVGVFSLLIIIWNTQAQAWTLGDERAFEFLVRHVTHTHLHALVVAQTQAQTYALQFWSVQEAHCLLGLCSLVLGFTALFKKHWPLYAAGCFTACGLTHSLGLN